MDFSFAKLFSSNPNPSDSEFALDQSELGGIGVLQAQGASQEELGSYALNAALTNNTPPSDTSWFTSIFNNISNVVKSTPVAGIVSGVASAVKKAGQGQVNTKTVQNKSTTGWSFSNVFPSIGDGIGSLLGGATKPLIPIFLIAIVGMLVFFLVLVKFEKLEAGL